MPDSITIAHIPLPLVFLQNFVTVLFSHTPESSDLLAGLIIVCIVVYTVALIFSKKTSCIIIFGWKDLILVAATEIVIAFILLYNTFYGRDNGKPVTANNIAANVVIVLSVMATFTVSVIANLRYTRLPQAIFYIIISITAKPVIMTVMAVFVFLSIGLLSAAYQPGKKDRRYKSGHRPGKYNWLIPIIIAVMSFLAAFLIGGIIKNPREICKKEPETYQKEYNQKQVVRQNGKSSRSGTISNKEAWRATFLLCVFLGWIGIHRFYTRHIFTGLLMLLTMGGCGIWWIIDIIIILAGKFKDKEGNCIRSK
jgi:hypothetical protein